jgi:hypothetical protein
VKIQVTWNDGFAGQNQTSTVITLAVSGTAGNDKSIEFPVHAAASTTIAYQTVWTGGSGCTSTGTYAFSIGAALAQP